MCNSKDLVIFHLYIYNQYDYMEFIKHFKEYYGDYHEEKYLEEQWYKLQNDPTKYLLNHREIIDSIIEDIKNKNYKG